MTTKTARKENSTNTKNRIESLMVVVPQIELVNLEIKIVGDSPLICHAWADKAKKEILDKQQKKAKQAKEAKVPAHDFASSLYWLTDRPTSLSDDPDEAMLAVTEAVRDGRFGILSNAFKMCAVSACRFVDGMAMTEARGAFYVNGEFVEIESSPPIMREDMVRLGGKSADIRYRGEFTDWGVTLSITLNRLAMSAAQVVNLFNLGGFGVGVCEWRPEKNGPYGRFHVGE